MIRRNSKRKVERPKKRWNENLQETSSNGVQTGEALYMKRIKISSRYLLLNIIL